MFNPFVYGACRCNTNCSQQKKTGSYHLTKKIPHFAFESAHEKMFENKITGVRENEDEENVWKLCLQPMLRWMRYIGLLSEHQHLGGIGHVIRRWTIYLSSIVILSLLFVSLLVWENTNTTLADWLDFPALTFYIVGINTNILFLTQPETWSSLVNSFQFHLPYATAIGLKFRKFSILAVFYIIISNGSFLIMNLIPVLIEDSPECLVSTILYLLAFFSKIYPTTAVTLLFLLLFLISIELKDIRCKLLNDHHTSKISNELKSLKRQHAMICRSVEKINEIFGYIILVEVVSIFVGTVTNMMFLNLPGMRDVDSYSNYMVIFTITYYIDQLLRFFCITVLADRIPHENMNIYYTLTECENVRDELKDDMQVRSSFETQVFRMNPQIEAAGIFTVSKRLFPTLIGTTLTYFFILMDFSKTDSVKSGSKTFNGSAANTSLASYS